MCSMCVVCVCVMVVYLFFINFLCVQCWCGLEEEGNLQKSQNLARQLLVILVISVWCGECEGILPPRSGVDGVF